LPGGRIDLGETAEAAALREASEEIGVNPASVRILGALTPLYVLVSRFLVTPFVGVTASRPDFRIAEREVAELIEAPLDQLRDRRILHWDSRTPEGFLIDFPYFSLGHHRVWGATAMMLGEFVSVLDEGFGPSEQPR
jgi:8-oxo-dGTP pyrophosphatase MutT (NUDIX family)